MLAENKIYTVSETNQTVTRKKSDYNNKMLKLVDIKYYEICPKDPTTNYQNKNNKFVNSFLEKQLIDKSTRDKLIHYQQCHRT